MLRRLFALLAPCLLISGVAAQQLRWQLEPYASARYARKIEWQEKILVPEGATLVADAPPARTDLPGADLIQNGSIEKLNRANPRNWGKRVFRGTGSLAVDKQRGRHGKRSLLIKSPKGIDAGWMQTVKVTPRCRYRLSGFIRVDNVDRGGGAQLGIFELGKSAVTEPVRGTTDWVAVKLEFGSGAHQSIRVVCSLGAWRTASGAARFDGITLREIAAPVRSKTLRSALFRGNRRPPILWGRDLDPRRQSPVLPVTDLRDLPALLAFDLRRARSATLKRQTANPRGFDPIWYESRYASVDADGKQVVHVRIGSGKPRRSKPAAKRAKGKGKGKGKPAPARSRVSGTVKIERHIDRGAQRVRGFTATMQLQVEPAAAGPLPGIQECSLSCTETWSWQRDGAANDAHFKARVNEAISTGARSLRGDYGTKRLAAGKLALVVLTLLKAGESPRDPMMRQLLKKVRRRGLTKTYDLAVSIMALEALYAPPDERDMLMSGRLVRPVPRKPNPEDRALLQEWVDTLLKNIDLRVDPAYLRRWNYTPAKRFDNSNTQYALLGLYTASLCGVEVSPQVWFAAANHWLAVQRGPEREPVQLRIVSHRDLAKRQPKAGWKNASATRRTVTRGVPVKPRGWGYGGKGSKATGSMTTAGITGLVICEAALRAQEKGTRKLRSRIQESIDGGFAWLARYFSVKDNPGGGARWHYYYLYGLERACELNGTAIFQGRRWYTEGAEFLLAKQKPHGAWASLEDTCFAILFLKKAAPPVVTGPR